MSNQEAQQINAREGNPPSHTPGGCYQQANSDKIQMKLPIHKAQALWDSWLTITESVKNDILLRTNEIFSQLKQAACPELERSAARFARLGTSDETVYECLVKLMEVYQRVVERASAINQESPTVDALLAGICEVLGSRLKEFSETSPEEIQPSAENPVTQEKQIILDRALACVSEQLDNMSASFLTMLQEEHPNTWAELCSVAPTTLTIESVIAKECLPQIYIHFQENLRICLSQLDDLHSRKVAGLYTELFEREWEELGNIIKVQVMALESATTETTSPAYTEDLQEVYHILNILREAYQYTGPVVDELQRLLNSPPIANPAEFSYEEFIKIMGNAITPSKSEGNSSDLCDFLIYENGRTFAALFAAEIMALFGQLTPELEKTADQMHCVISNSKLLAENIVQAFENVQKTLPVITPELEIPACEQETPLSPDEIKLQQNILQGICETISIKIESLKDSIQIFGEEATNLLQSCMEEIITPTDKEITEATDAAIKQWLYNAPYVIEDIETLFTTISENDDFIKYKTRTQKRTDSHIDKTEKLIFRFKKDVLLYEICTYEEILTHSASRLHGSAWPEMAETEKKLTAAYNHLEVILEQNNITPIRPQAHEQFNAFEHEILMAEKQEGFNKGEIIKIVNTGYKQQDKVILRANIIAAR